MNRRTGGKTYEERDTPTGSNVTREGKGQAL